METLCIMKVLKKDGQKEYQQKKYLIDWKKRLEIYGRNKIIFISSCQT